MNVTDIIQNWYDLNMRELPWRMTSDPYKIWLSEVILQQTRIDQGLIYYLNIVEEYPTINDLALASEDEVLKLWQGLGYYSRARNMLQAAQEVVKNHNGTIPNDYKSLIALKGIGEYTAAAILSFAYNQAYAVVDGNVFRFLSRLFTIKTPIDSGKGKREFSELANHILDKKNPGKHNQAIMEFGSQYCVSKNPDCLSCPFNSQCMAYQEGIVNDLPVKQGRVNKRTRYFYYLIGESKETIFIRKRSAEDIWKGLYEFPYIETRSRTSIEKLICSQDFKDLFNHKSIHIRSTSKMYKHILSHQTIYARFIHFQTDLEQLLDCISIPRYKLKNFALPRIIDRYLEEYKFFESE